MSTPVTYLAKAEPTGKFVGVCEACIYPVAIEAEVKWRDNIRANCPGCGHPLTVERVYGTLTKMSCDPSCESAIGPVCVCGCGGANHSNRWFKTGEMTASVLADFRAAYSKRQEAAKKAAKTRRANAAQAKAEKKAKAFSEWLGMDGVQPLVAELTSQDDWTQGQYPNSFLASMADIVAHGDRLSPNQTAAVQRILSRRHYMAEKAAKAQANENQPATDGVYLAQLEGDSQPTVYVVKPTRDGKRHYAMRLTQVGPKRLTLAGEVVQWEMRYVQGVVYHLAEDDRAALADVEKYLIAYGRCLYCGRSLKDPKSVKASIGPVCIKKFKS
jgi:Family of unknown function (DUF6011)